MKVFSYITVFCCICLSLIFFTGTVRAADDPMVIKLGIVTTPGTNQHVCAVQFKELVQERSGGDIQVKIFHSGSLGTETEILQQIQLNAVQIGVITLGPFDAFVPEVKAAAFPFLFRDHAQADAVLDGPLGREVLNSLESAGFKGLHFSENGFRHLTNNKRPVHSVQDVKGLKIRVMESVLHKELWKTLGANPTPMGWPIYTELQQGTIDAQENPLSVIALYKLYEVQEHLSLTGHIYSAHIDVANLQWFNSLSPEDQKLIMESMAEAARRQRKVNRETNASNLAKLKEHGMNVVESPDIDSFRKQAVRLKELKLFQDAATKRLLNKFLEAVR